MNRIQEYVFSVVVIALLCSIISNLMQHTHMKQLGKILCGLVLLFAVLRPFTEVREIDFGDFMLSYEQEAQEAVALGEQISLNSLMDIIKLETEAYILDKAAAVQADITVTVSVREDPEPSPVSAEITGSVSPYARLMLERMMEENLGITKENQRWIG